MNIVEKAISSLLTTNPFYAYFFLNCEVQYDTHKVPTAGVKLSSRGITMIFNTEFVKTLSPLELGAVIEHEVLHILFDHVSAAKKNKTIQTKIANVAMDCSINQFIQNLPKECITLKSLEKTIKTKLEPLQDWEYYYGKIMSSPEVIKAMSTLDDHDGWEDGDFSAEAKISVRAAAESALKSAKGSAPKEVLRAMDVMRAESKIPWQQILANFVSRATSSSTKNTRKKQNRRFGLDQPGKLKKRELVLGVCCDSSGSVSDESYNLFLSEISRISKYCNKVYLLDADCEVHDVSVLTKGKIPAMVRRGYGGTAYQPAITKCIELKVDAIVYFGDMDSADLPENPKIPFLWAAVGDQSPPANFGSILRL